jgi:hypothetical protein
MTLAHWSMLVALGTVFGASFGFNEILLSAYGPLTVSAGRVGLIGTFGVFQYAAPFALLPIAQQHITSSSAGIANAMTPVAVSLSRICGPAESGRR